jgi:hypothetical protein
MDTVTETHPTGNQQQPKRVRISPHTEMIPFSNAIPSLVAPLTRARNVTMVTLASLSPAIRSLPEQSSFEFLRLKAELLRVANNRLRLNDDALIANSARIKFTLGSTDRVLEDFSDELSVLQTDAANEVTFFQAKIRDIIRKASDLEKRAAHAALVKQFCIAVSGLSIAFSILNPHFPREHAHNLIITTFEDHHKSLLKHIALTRVQFFEQLHIHTNCVGTVYVVGSLAVAPRNIVRPAVEQFKNLIEGLFIRRWDEYLFTLEVNERTIEVKKFVENEYKTASTIATALALEDAPTDGDTVRDVVSSESNQKLKKLKKQVDFLTQAQARSQKNSAKGTSTSSQPSRRNKGGKDKETSRNRKQPPAAQKAAAAANATSAASKKPNNKKKNKKKKPSPAASKK